MRLISLPIEKARTDFALEAARFFARNPEMTSYTAGEITSGCLFAIRWGLGRDCVLVLQLDEAVEPVIYENVVEPVN